jgi:hypothetical protein
MRYLRILAAFAAVSLFSGLTGFQTVVTITPALAWGSEVLLLDGLQLPRWHRYEQYNPETASYGSVRVDAVPSYVRQGTWIYDRTAEAWVAHPSVGQPNPQYVASGRDFRRGELLGQRRSEVLLLDGLQLPRWHRYERYNPETGSYETVPVDIVPSYVRQGTWIYDRTADAWVSHPAVGHPNPQYAAFGRDFRR